MRLSPQQLAQDLWRTGGGRTRLARGPVQHSPRMSTHLYRAGHQTVALRVEHPGAPGALATEAWALDWLKGSALGPQRLASTDGAHLLQLPPGSPADLSDPEALHAVGVALGRVHSTGGVKFSRQAARSQPTSVLGVFQQLQGATRRYLGRRAEDGLPPDLFTQALSEGLRALKRYVAASEHQFLPPPARVLCHGNLTPDALRVNGLHVGLVDWDRAHAGDAAGDLAMLWETAGLGEPAVLMLLEGWTQGHGRSDDGMVARICARRVLLRLQRTLDTLRSLQDWADAQTAGLLDQGPHLLAWMAHAREQVARAFNAVTEFTGPARPLSVAEVEGMGALLAVEELQLRGTGITVGLHGGPAEARAEVAQALGRRLAVPVLDVAEALEGAARAAAISGELDVQRVNAALDGMTALPALSAPQPDAPRASSEALLNHPDVRAALGRLMERVSVGGLVAHGPLPSDGFPAGFRACPVGDAPVATQVRALLRAWVPEPLAPSDAGLSGRPLLFA